MSAGQKDRLLQDIDAMQMFGTRIAAELHTLPAPDRAELFLEFMAAHIAGLSGTIAVAMEGHELATANALEVAVLRLREATEQSAAMLRAGLIDGCGGGAVH